MVNGCSDMGINSILPVFNALMVSFVISSLKYTPYILLPRIATRVSRTILEVSASEFFPCTQHSGAYTLPSTSTVCKRMIVPKLAHPIRFFFLVRPAPFYIYYDELPLQTY